MLDARQAQIIAWLSDYGVTHNDADCTPEAIEAGERITEETGLSASMSWYREVSDATGLQPVSRFQIHEWAASRAYDVESYPQGYGSELVEMMNRRDTLTATIDVLDTVEDQLDEDGYDATGTFHSDVSDLNDGRDLLSEMLSDLEAEIEEVIETYSQEICDACGNPIT